MIRLSLVETQNSIKAKVIFALAKKANDLLVTMRPQIEAATRRIVREELNNSGAIRSILGQDYLSLKVQFGLTDDLAIKAVDQIINSIEENIEVYPQVNKGNSDLLGSLIIDVLPFNLDELLGLSSATYTSRPSGSTIDWLRWLLFQGTTIVIDDWSLFQAESVSSRTDGTIMRNTGAFRVEGPYAGTDGDNFITRAIESAQPRILEEIRIFFKQSL